MNNGFEGCYGGFTTPIHEFEAARRAAIERAVGFEEVRRSDEKNV